MRPHLAKRFAFFLLGIALLYAPAALLTRALLALTGAPYTADAHRVCLRMPVEWIAQPWMYRTMIENPLYLVVLIALPATAFFLGPLFCGWICPAGQLPEFLGKIIPDRLKIDLAGRINPSPVRYGVLAGMVLAPFFGANICCAFCNFNIMQQMVSAAFGNFAALAHWCSFTIITFFLWFFLLGLLVKGGRGWCNFICPAGALMGLAHAVGSRLKTGRALRVDIDKCAGCKTCAGACPAWAISVADRARINLHACNACMDCAVLCPQGAIRYGRAVSAGKSDGEIEAVQ